MRGAGLALAAALLLAAPAQGAETKYSLANGCVAFENASGDAVGTFRLKATTLAQYLLYTEDGRFRCSATLISPAASMRPISLRCAAT